MDFPFHGGKVTSLRNNSIRTLEYHIVQCKRVEDTLPNDCSDEGDNYFSSALNSLVVLIF
jgi:hypothetical protein